MDCKIHGEYQLLDFYYEYGTKLKGRSWRGVLDTTLCDKICQ